MRLPSRWSGVLSRNITLVNILRTLTAQTGMSGVVAVALLFPLHLSGGADEYLVSRIRGEVKAS